jgi:hypothetical protein
MLECGKDQQLEYFSLGAGSIFAMEGLIYRLPEKRRNELIDQKAFFCDFVSECWPKRKFTMTFPEDFAAFELNLTDCLAEW